MGATSAVTPAHLSNDECQMTVALGSTTSPASCVQREKAYSPIAVMVSASGIEVSVRATSAATPPPLPVGRLATAPGISSSVMAPSVLPLARMASAIAVSFAPVHMVSCVIFPTYHSARSPSIMPSRTTAAMSALSCSVST